MGQLNAKPKVVAPKPAEPKNSSASDNSFSKPENQPKSPADDCYENLDNLPPPEESSEVKSPATGSSSQEKLKLDNKKSAETTSTSKFKLPQDTKTKADPFSARYDTLRMMPDVQWDNKSPSRNDPTPIKVPKDTKTKVDPFNANYDTLLMTPEPKWTEKEKKEKEKSKSKQL